MRAKQMGAYTTEAHINAHITCFNYDVEWKIPSRPAYEGPAVS